mmetsp:Transcript_45974/g.33734  ORF Transcript_45974/g.33734 Transcript_45974/m.33734 type:complete len:94 (+) Transcript_45974:42-323(+)
MQNDSNASQSQAPKTPLSQKNAMSIIGTPTSFIKRPLAQKSPYLKELTNTPGTSKFAMEASLFAAELGRVENEPAVQDKERDLGQSSKLEFRP